MPKIRVESNSPLTSTVIDPLRDRCEIGSTHDTEDVRGRQD
ncbi:MAG: hypothetical protein ACK5EA_27490 [Planctomycetaceae bacterium]